jgi:hypothetical protein
MPVPPCSDLIRGHRKLVKVLELDQSKKGGWDGAAAVLRQGEREEGAMDAGGGCQAAGIHLQPWHRQLDLRSPEGRSSIISMHWS